MKKILSAVFVMAMLIIAATITGSVLAAEPYQYTPDDGKPVVYLSSTGDVNASIAATSNGKEYASMKAAGVLPTTTAPSMIPPVNNLDPKEANDERTQV